MLRKPIRKKMWATPHTGRVFRKPFRYRHLGNLATIGRSAAVADFGFLRLSGYLAWVLAIRARMSLAMY